MKLNLIKINFMEDLFPSVINAIFCISLLLRIFLETIVEDGAEQEKTWKNIHNMLTVVLYGCACFFGFKLVEIIF